MKRLTIPFAAVLAALIAVFIGAVFVWVYGFGKTNGAHMPAPPDNATVRMLTGGEVIGLTTTSGAHSWRGLAYAAAPVGDLRWRAPRPPEGWAVRRQAIEFAERCTQITTGLNASEGLEAGLLIGSEDCLYLDIYAPPGALQAKLAGRDIPVMVWIHGGSNVWGRSSSYDGSNLALNEEVIIVTVQYRLGPLGWFSHPFLRESAQTRNDMAANFATLDLVQALSWVRENIAAFGGDPANVTIFGESAGGHNVATLLASPLAKGLFHRAILQSGSFDSTSVAEAENGGPGATIPSMTIVDRLDVSGAQELRAAPLEAIFDAYDWVERGFINLPTVIEDGVTLPAAPMREAFASTDTFNVTPIITGTNLDEMKLFHISSDDLTKKVLGVFIAPRDKDFYNAVSDYPSRIWRIRSVDQPAALMAAAGHHEVYAYRFDWDEGGRLLWTDLKVLLGASHAMEIPFVFNRFQLLGPLDKVMFKKKTRQSREELSAAMGAYWAAFARTGAPAPGGEHLPEWPQWSTQGGSLMRFDAADDGGPEVMRDLATLDALVADLKADPRLDDADRCRVVEAIDGWLPGLAATIGKDVGCAPPTQKTAAK